jgi:hypothetical protein
MKLSLAGQQALPEEFLGELEAAALGEVSVVGDENIPNVVRVVE